MTGVTGDSADSVEALDERGGVRPRWVSWLGVLLAVLLAGAAGGWALRAILAPAPDVLASAGFTLVTAQQGAVGQSLRLNTSAQWVPQRTVVGQAAGVVTTADLEPGTRADTGVVLFTVDLRPVVAASGDVPAFRDLSFGASGADVAQLQRMLAALGHYSGSADGNFGQAVTAAVRAWQRELGVPVDGVVRRGDVVFGLDLPARLSLPPEVTVGTVLAGGEPVVHVLPEAPEFAIALPEGQARLVATGVAVEVSHGDGVWQAEVAEVRQHPETGGLIAVLVGLDGSPVCGDECGAVPLGEMTLLSSTIHVVPEVTGVVVPVAAVVSTAQGQTVVATATGDLVQVTVVASASGIAVVEGIEAGTQVRAPGPRSAGGNR